MARRSRANTALDGKLELNATVAMASGVKRKFGGGLAGRNSLRKQDSSHHSCW